MNEIDGLTGKVLDWQKTGEGFQDLIAEISEIVLQYPAKHFGWQKDECADFYCYFYKRILRLIEYFKYQDKPFIALLNNSLSWQVRTFYRKHRLLETERTCLKYNIIENDEYFYNDESLLEVSEPAKKVLRLDADGVIKDEWLRRRFIILVLKNTPYLNEQYITAFSRISGCNTEWLAASVSKLRMGMMKKTERFEMFTQRANKAFMDICRIHKCIEESFMEEEKRCLCRELLTAEKRFKRALRGKASVKLMPSNYEIAVLLDIPKGTVDSSLYYIKKDLSARI